jgi:cytochrome P450
MMNIKSNEQITMHPKNPIAAVSHADPYPYYQGLLEQPDLYFDMELKLWIASRAEVIEEILANPHCAVRPSAELVPNAIAGSSAGEVFANLIRMNEGIRHERPKSAMHLALSSLDTSNIAVRTFYFAEMLANKQAITDAAALNNWMFDLPVYVVGDLLGFTEDELPKLALWMADFVRCLSPLSNEAQLAAASVAADALSQSFRNMIRTASPQSASLLSRVLHEANIVGWDNLDGILANLIGLLSQTYEATAGLIGNCIVALCTQENLPGDLCGEANKISAFVEEVARFDPPVQSTRRFVNEDTNVAGIELMAGEAILVVLAAASRDAQANSAPNDFVLNRTDRRLFGFGHGRHACPGQKLACLMATQAMHYVLESGLNVKPDAMRWVYCQSLNGRIPVFTNTNKRT